jgi:hypothetical protein
MGRWISRDPIAEWGGSNLYGFVGNDPFDFFDILGKIRIKVGFYGAGRAGGGGRWTYGNGEMRRIFIEATIKAYGYTRKRSAYCYILDEIDRNPKDNVITQQEVNESAVKIMGYSWGGPSATWVSRKLNKGGSNRAVTDCGITRCVKIPVRTLFLLDPVRRWGVGENVENNVHTLWNLYQRKSGWGNNNSYLRGYMMLPMVVNGKYDGHKLNNVSSATSNNQYDIRRYLGHARSRHFFINNNGAWEWRYVYGRDVGHDFVPHVFHSFAVDRMKNFW